MQQDVVPHERNEYFPFGVSFRVHELERIENHVGISGKVVRMPGGVSGEDDARVRSLRRPYLDLNGHPVPPYVFDAEATSGPADLFKVFAQGGDGDDAYGL